MAEVSLSGDGEIISAEIQQIEHSEDKKTTFSQVLQLQLKREQGDKYLANSLRYQGKQLANQRVNWFDGACRFFKQTTALIKKGTAPRF